MTRKKIRPPRKWVRKPAQAGNLQDPEGLEDLPQELLGYDKEVVLNTERGSNAYNQALRKLTYRFQRVMLQDPKGTEDLIKMFVRPGEKVNATPEFFTQAVVHSIISHITLRTPVDDSGQPLGVDELCAILGAVVGMSAAAAVDRGEVSLQQVDQLTDTFYVGMREAIPRGILLTRRFAQMSGKNPGQ